MKRILVPLDGSPLAEAALPHAIGLSARSGAELVLVSVAEDLVGMLPEGMAYERPHPWADELAGYLERMQRLVQARTELVTGAPAEEILKWAETLAVDAVVMGTHGRRGASRWMLGSVGDKVMRNAPCPVVLVRSPEVSPDDTTLLIEQAVAGSWPRYPRILLPLDGTANSESALGPACWMARQDQSELTIMRVLDFPDPVFSSTEIPSTWTDMVRADLELAHQRYLNTRACQLEAEGLKVSTAHRHGPPADRILEQEQDLIVLASRSRGAFFGSVAERVVHRARCPVMLVRGRTSLIEERASSVEAV